MFDFSDADKQREFVPGPIPAGSMVLVDVEVVQPMPERQAVDDPFVSIARSGIRQIYCQFTVVKGSYQGVTFRQNITLPVAYQKINLSQNQKLACNIGASMLKAICQAAGKEPQVKSLTDFTGFRIPVRVKINPMPKEKDGVTYWNNEITLIITPDKEEYAQVCEEGEIINLNGAITGQPKMKPTTLAAAKETLPPPENPKKKFSFF